ncbi:MAG: phosphodiester glycosidase family protein, partial [Leptolyngbya sp.]|nr:phosphodiester glycosidase family protein [Leptolyngbya sp.]
TQPLPPPSPSPTDPIPSITYQVYRQDTAQLHVVAVPPGAGYTVGVAVPEGLVPLSEQAAGLGAIAALNGGFFDPQNGLTTSFVTVAGTLAADPRQNPRLMDNPDLQSYLPGILDRSEFRIYACGEDTHYAIDRHSAPIPANCTLTAAVGAGPQLLPENTGYGEGFLADNAAGETVRDVLGSRSPNARSAVALTADGTVILAMAAQGEGQPGFTLDQMAAFLTRLGAIAALNLDGGSSSSLYFEGETVYGRRDPEGAPIQRPVKSILWVR